MKYKLFRIMVIIKLETKKSKHCGHTINKIGDFLLTDVQKKFVDTHAFQKGNKRNAGPKSGYLTYTADTTDKETKRFITRLLI